MNEQDSDLFHESSGNVTQNLFTMLTGDIKIMHSEGQCNEAEVITRKTGGFRSKENIPGQYAYLRALIELYLSHVVGFVLVRGALDEAVLRVARVAVREGDGRSELPPNPLRRDLQLQLQTQP